MLCIELKRRGSAECIGCYVCAEVLGERETLILRYFVLEQSKHNREPSRTWKHERDFAFRNRQAMLQAVSPYLSVEKSSIYRSVTRLQQMRIIRQPEQLEGRQSEFAATAKGDTVYRLKRMQIHGICLTEQVQPFRHDLLASLASDSPVGETSPSPEFS